MKLLLLILFVTSLSFSNDINSSLDYILFKDVKEIEVDAGMNLKTDKVFGEPVLNIWGAVEYYTKYYYYSDIKLGLDKYIHSRYQVDTYAEINTFNTAVYYTYDLGKYVDLRQGVDYIWTWENGNEYGLYSSIKLEYKFLYATTELSYSWDEIIKMRYEVCPSFPIWKNIRLKFPFKGVYINKFFTHNFGYSLVWEF